MGFRNAIQLIAAITLGACHPNAPEVHYPLTVVGEKVPVVLVWSDPGHVLVCNPGDKNRENCHALVVPENPQAPTNEKCKLEIVSGTLAPAVATAKVLLGTDQDKRLIDEWLPDASLEADAFSSYAAWSPGRRGLIVAHVISFLGEVPTSRVVKSRFVAIANCQHQTNPAAGIKPL